MSIDYSKAQFYFIGTRKHLIRDRTYHIYIFEDKILMGYNIIDSSPKYNIQLTLSTKLGWVPLLPSGKIVLQAFVFSDKDKQKEMYANAECLQRFKNLISCKVTFSNIADFYELQFIIGKGSSAKVFECIRLIDNQLFAIKAIGKDYLESCEQGMLALKTEVSILSQLTRLTRLEALYFIQLYEVFEGNLTVYLVIELMQGQTLQSKLSYYKDQQKLMPINQVKLIMLQLLQGVSVMHKNQIIHRDLKPDNIMFEKNGSINNLKIVDFGLAVRKDVEKYQYRKCGTPGYVAPEILNLKQNKHSYGELCDIFSCGVIFFKLYPQSHINSLGGNAVFIGTTIEEVLKKNRSCMIDFNRSDIKHIDQPERQLLQAMLQKDPLQRVSADSALQFDFFTIEDIKSLNVESTDVRIEQQNELPPLLIPLPQIPLDQISNNSPNNNDSDGTPFCKLANKKVKLPLCFTYKDQKVDFLVKQNQNQEKFVSINSINSMDEEMDKEQYMIQQIPIFKFQNFKNQASNQIESQGLQTIQFTQDQYQKVQQQGPQRIKDQMRTVNRDQSQKLSLSNRSSLGNINSFYMKDPLSNLFKHQQFLSRMSNDGSPSPLIQTKPPSVD